MIEGKRIRLRAFEGTDATANHEFVNDPETLRGMMSGIPFPSSYADEQQWLSQQSSYTRGEYQSMATSLRGAAASSAWTGRTAWQSSPS